MQHYITVGDISDVAICTSLHAAEASFLKKRVLSGESCTHREMIPGGKFLGMALVSTQKALSLVQEQVAGQRGAFGAFLVYDSPVRQRHRHTTDIKISLVHLGPSSSIPLGKGGGEKRKLSVWASWSSSSEAASWLRSDTKPAYAQRSSVKTERRAPRDSVRGRGREWGGGGRLLLHLLSGCGCFAASLVVILYRCWQKI